MHRRAPLSDVSVSLTNLKLFSQRRSCRLEDVPGIGNCGSQARARRSRLQAGKDGCAAGYKLLRAARVGLSTRELRTTKFSTSAIESSPNAISAPDRGLPAVRVLLKLK